MATRRAFKRRGYRPNPVGAAAYIVGETVGRFTIKHYMGHSTVNKRNNHIMAKAQHWYRCMCTCGTPESRSQQELTDKRRQQCCYNCRDIGKENEDKSQSN